MDAPPYALELEEPPQARSMQRMVGHRELEPRANEASDAAGGGRVGCETCPFKSGDFNPKFLKARLKENYDTNHMGCRKIWPEWKPGLCHKGGLVCAGYSAGNAGGGRDSASKQNGAQVPNEKEVSDRRSGNEPAQAGAVPAEPVRSTDGLGH